MIDHAIRSAFYSGREMQIHGWDDNSLITRPWGEGYRLDNFNNIQYRHFGLDNTPLFLNYWSFGSQTPGQYNNGSFKVSFNNPPETNINVITLGSRFSSEASSINRCSGGGGGGGGEPIYHDPLGSVVLSPVNQWNHDYYMNQQYLLGENDSFIVNSDIEFVINVENMISNKVFDSASTILSSYNPTNPIALDFKEIASIFVETRLGDTIVTEDTAQWITYRNRIDSSYITVLTTIAEKSTIYESPYAINARVLLWDEFRIYIDDTLGSTGYFPDIEGVAVHECDEVGEWQFYLEDETGVFYPDLCVSDSIGNFWFMGDEVARQLDTSQNVLYRVVAISPILSDTLRSEFDDLLSLATIGEMSLLRYCDIEGDVDETCSDTGTWSVQIVHATLGTTGFISFTNTSHEFLFDAPTVFSTLDTSSTTLYRFMAVSQNLSDTLYSLYYSLPELSSIVHSINCLEPSTPYSHIQSINKESWKPTGAIHQNTLHLHINTEVCKVKVMDLTGRIIWESTVDSKTTFNVGDWKSGVYIIQFTNQTTGEIKNQKILK